MSKLIIQMLISVVLSVSAVAGFSPDVREKVTGTLHEVQALAHDVTQSIFETDANVDADVSAEVEVQSEADMGLDLKSLVDDSSDLLPNASVDNSVSVESDADVKVESDEASLDLENTLETISDISVGIGE